ncbi:hypothetical protein L207DRAFT_446206 [Hyaloscypha variabilis F]|uniref:Uncharacterized protein n=1 Tax=Hyaloscypha variabilis (strain UAMH 11265 / GT02V1 / F) TaxID=1149755 RepID=A0A2J6QRY4_HYAVF|nr:hypothetical protein L207DRAFT_446206 [Hyaloscypha variabilis F]
MIYLKRIRIHLTRTFQEQQKPPQNENFEEPYQLLMQPPAGCTMMLRRDPPHLPTNLCLNEQEAIISRLYDRLSQCMFDFVATNQIPLPLDPRERLIQRPSDCDWIEWVHLLKQLAIKGRIPAHVLHHDEINQLFAVLESPLQLGRIAQSKVPRDDRTILQMVFAGIQVARLLQDSMGVDYLDMLYTGIENVCREKRALSESRS